MDIINKTPHTITLLYRGLTKIFPADPIPARVSVEIHHAADILPGIPGSVSVYGEVEGLPPADTYVHSHLYIVSRMVADACPDREDLLIPAELVRDDDGRVIGCRSFERAHVHATGALTTVTMAPVEVSEDDTTHRIAGAVIDWACDRLENAGPSTRDLASVAAMHRQTLSTVPDGLHASSPVWGLGAYGNGKRIAYAILGDHGYVLTFATHFGRESTFRFCVRDTDLVEYLADFVPREALTHARLG